MLRGILALVVAAGLAGCSSAPEDPESADQALAEETRCAGPQDLICAFINSPVRVGGDPVTIPGREVQFFRTSHDLTFIDSDGVKWVAPIETLTDGASIPPIFVRLVGSPTSREFVNAAAVHDAYCGIGNEEGTKFQQADWEDVHRMFYEALIVGGTPKAKAGAMYSAVWLGGPRWDIPEERDMNNLPTRAKQRSLQRTLDFIERKDPTFDQLHEYLWWEEKKMRKRQKGLFGFTQRL